jgi:RNA polymerase sigma-70 factor, ECF subfamily
MTRTEAVEFPAVAGQRASRGKAPEDDLVRRVQARDEMAFRELVDRYQSRVFSIIYGVLRNHNDAEDIAQQVFAKIYFAIGSFDSRSSLLTWVHRITINECYDYLRKRRVRKLVYESDLSTEETEGLENSESPDLATPLEHELAERDFVLKLLATVSEEARSLILLKEVEGHSVEEVAAMTGLNENTVKIKLFRTRKKLLSAARRLGKRNLLRAALAAPSKTAAEAQKPLWITSLFGARA